MTSWEFGHVCAGLSAICLGRPTDTDLQSGLLPTPISLLQPSSPSLAMARGLPLLTSSMPTNIASADVWIGHV